MDIDLHESVQVSDSLSIDARTLFSLQHIQSAAIFARNAFEIERDYDGKFSEERIAKHHAYVYGSIFSSVAFLEAQINEFFSGINDEHIKGKYLADEYTKNLGLVWSVIGKKRIWFLEKYNIALEIAEKEKFDERQSPFSELKSLGQLRNKLIHAESKWVRVLEDNTPTKITMQCEINLVDKFDLNPLTGDGNPFFPDKCMGHGCAKWAVENCIKFSDKFFERMGMPVPYAHLRKRLNA